MKTVDVRSYLFFGGRCEEALNFYQAAIGAKPGMVLRFSESPDPAPEGMIPPGFENKIMHAEMQVGDVSIMMSDGCDTAEKFQGFRLTLTVPTQEEAEKLYAALADGGVEDMPLTPTFWSPCYGQVTDKFGLGWMVMVPGEE
ncbi:VOC family protein [Thalassoglobus sp. JC818]|uniref:VOC family protein n=1 Tax=Thalassoglobus sp. JC818 TaxID=3232136 RepID=UPI00345AB26E